MFHDFSMHTILSLKSKLLTVWYVNLVAENGETSFSLYLYHFLPPLFPVKHDYSSVIHFIF